MVKRHRSHKAGGPSPFHFRSGVTCSGRAAAGYQSNSNKLATRWRRVHHERLGLYREG